MSHTGRLTELALFNLEKAWGAGRRENVIHESKYLMGWVGKREDGARLFSVVSFARRGHGHKLELQENWLRCFNSEGGEAPNRLPGRLWSLYPLRNAQAQLDTTLLQQGFALQASRVAYQSQWLCGDGWQPETAGRSRC